jgi:transmembrane sensor
MTSLPTRTAAEDALLDEALDWVIRLKTGAPTRDDVDALQHWRQQSAAHEEAFKSAVRLYRHAGAAAGQLADIRTAAVPVAGRSSPRPLARRAVLAGGMAAAAAYAVARPPFGLWPSIEEMTADYRTGKGERRSVALGPGSSLELNTQTSVALRPGSNETRVELISGEVAATISSTTPIVLLARDGTITASKASFDVRCFNQTVSVACLDGSSIMVEHRGNAVKLDPTQQVSYSRAGLEPQIAIDVTQVSAWKTGLLIFRDRPLANVVDEVNRYRPGKIIITSNELRHRLVNGTFQLDRLDNFAGQIEELFGASVTHLPGGIVLIG